MTNAMTHGSTTARMLLPALLLAAAAASAQVAPPWSTTAIAGAVEPQDTASIAYNSNATTVSASMRGTAPLPANVELRFNVTPVPGLLEPAGMTYLRLRYRDNGSYARVTARLIGVGRSDGLVTTYLTFNSDDRAQGNAYRTEEVSLCNQSLDFDNQAILLEVVLTKTASTGSPVFVTGEVGVRDCE